MRTFTNTIEISINQQQSEANQIKAPFDFWSNVGEFSFSVDADFIIENATLESDEESTLDSFQINDDCDLQSLLDHDADNEEKINLFINNELDS